MNPTDTTTQTGPRIGVSAAARLAQTRAHELSEALAVAGFDVRRDFPFLHGDTTASDEPFITFGRIKPAVAERLAQMARRDSAQ